MIAAGQVLGELSEAALLDEIFPFFHPSPALLVGPGDDAAVLATGGRVVATTDTMVRGSDWLDEWSSADDVATKLLTQNLADVAAMGAAPTALLVTLVADPALPAAWAVEFARALGREADAQGATVAGGDLSSAPAGVVTVSVTAHGDLRGAQPVLRSGARPGDVVAVAGTLGRSAAGLRLLYSGRRDGRRPADHTGVAGECVVHHLRPHAPLAAGPQAAAAGATAMIDLSDGLLRDGDRVARASGVRLDVDLDLLRPDVSVLSGVVGEHDALECVLAGGEEHSLLATFPAGRLPEGWRRIGVAAAGEGVTLDGRAQEPRGWDHFRA